MARTESLSAYDLRRRDLIKLICPNRRCHWCTKRAPSFLAMEIDHVNGKGWISRRVNSMQRLRIMEREYAAGLEAGQVVLVGSCGPCNHSHGATKRYRWNIRAKRARRGRGYSSWAVGYTAHVVKQMEREEEVPF